MIGAVGAVDARGAADLRGDHHHGVSAAPPIPLRPGQRALLDIGQRQPADWPPSLARVSQLIEARAAIRTSSAAISSAALCAPPRASRRWLLLPGFGFLASSESASSRAAALATGRRPGSRWRYDQPHRGVVIGLRQRQRRPADGLPHPAAPAAWSARRRDFAVTRSPSACASSARSAGFHPARAGKAASHPGRRNASGRYDAAGRRREPPPREPRYIRAIPHRWMQREDPASAPRAWAVWRQRDRAAGGHSRDRRDRRQASSRAAQDHDDQAAGRRRRGRISASRPRRRTRRRRAAARGATGRGRTFAAIHRHLLCNSGDISSSASRDPARLLMVRRVPPRQPLPRRIPADRGDAARGDARRAAPRCRAAASPGRPE